MTARALKHVEPIEAGADEYRQLRDLLEVLDWLDTVDERARVTGGEEEVLLPASLSRMLREALPLLLRGDAVAITALSRELTTQDAADLLNTSRQHLVNLLERGAIPFHKVGTHRRVRLSDVLEYRERRFREQTTALDELARLSFEAGQYDVKPGAA